MAIKIRLNQYIVDLTNNSTCKMLHPDGSSIDVIHLGKSRIDGNPIFHIPKSILLQLSNRSLVEYDKLFIPITHVTCNIDRIDLVSTLEDHMPGIKGNFQQNKDILLAFIMEKFNLDETALYDDEKFKSLMRRFNRDVSLDDILD